MPFLSSRPIVKEIIKTETVQGEITVNLNLSVTINLDDNGKVNLAVKRIEEVPEQLILEIPDLEVSPEEMISFGQDVK